MTFGELSRFILILDEDQSRTFCFYRIVKKNSGTLEIQAMFTVPLFGVVKIM